jgi:hypothetical protein
MVTIHFQPHPIKKPYVVEAIFGIVSYKRTDLKNRLRICGTDKK